MTFVEKNQNKRDDNFKMDESDIQKAKGFSYVSNVVPNDGGASKEVLCYKEVNGAYTHL